ncbi:MULTISPECIES: hypothetical protein [Streptomyces]|uniref:Lipoprotein n=1 Tax=Streptomyces dengpaensis TaxID=2049881 RepID=A0ABM6SS89_9ACTN|nr:MULTISPECIES: hypothetical protein [Streptomyces]AVH57560.1 hypothetical protein C4B68_19335 [Streptomyces dengpaensis]PIB02692.1 hypothetical protein B1C81_37965 [Streptomyces sp. HG99]
MNRPPRPSRTSLSSFPSRPTSLLASALTAGVLLSTAACASLGDSGDSGRTGVSASPAARQSPTPSDIPTLSEDQAKTALITNTDLGSQWSETEGAATWRDALLKSKVDAEAFVTDKAAAADCQKLLDGLYAEELLGEPSGARAVAGFDDSDNDAQMRYQVAAYGKAELDEKFAWLQTLPDKCDEFTAVDNKGGRQTVQVTEAQPPDDAGDANVGLKVTMAGELEGEPYTLTLDVGAVRVGDNALYLTNGGLDGADSDSTVQAIQAGTKRLEDTLAGKTPPPTQG